MKRLLTFLVLSLLLCGLSTFAGAYVISGVATAPGYPTSNTVAFGTASTPSSVLLPAWIGVQLAVVEDSKLYKTLIKTEDPGRWDLRVLVDPTYAIDAYTIKLWSANTSGAWKLVSNGETLWSGTFDGSSSTAPALSLMLPYSGIQKDFSLVAVPEPATMASLFSGLAGLAGVAIRRRK